MESDMAVELFTKNSLLDKENVDVNIIIGDDDSSTIAAIQRASSHQFTKWSDFNHVHKNFNNGLYALKLPRSLIEYFSKNFTCAIKQNKNDHLKIKNALLAVVPHAYGDHQSCGDWCAGRSSPDTYIHSHLPNGKSLTDQDLRVSLQQLFTKYANGSEKIAKCASTQSNESMNNLVASKNPKSKHYAGSESLCFRVAAAVSQKNVGSVYTKRVLDKLKLSSGYISTTYRKNKDKIKSMQSRIKKTIEFKKRRLMLKKNRSRKSATKSRKEGVSYTSGMSFEDVSNLIEMNNTDTTVEHVSDCQVVIFDLETSGLKKCDVILQVTIALM